MAPLLSRGLDPILGVFTGVFAYYLFETNPRTAPPQRDRLFELIKWKRAKSQQEKENQSNADDGIDWKALSSEGERK